VPATEALLPRFRAAHTQVLGVSVDSVYSHANWGADLGGVSFPLLSDFEPKGGVARQYGAYLEGPGITDRATVIIEAGGTVRYAHSVTPAGKRDIEELAAECEAVDRKHGGAKGSMASPTLIGGDAALYVKSLCGFSRAALLARSNLHLENAVAVQNVSQDPAALSELKQKASTEQAPCLLSEGKPLLESDAIIQRFVAAAAPL
jgi:hypothetical protein